jgi:hypothetical protein
MRVEEVDADDVKGRINGDACCRLSDSAVTK